MSSLTSSPIYPYLFVYLWISKNVEWFSFIKTKSLNWLTDLVHAKSTSELVSSGLDLAIAQSEVWSQLNAQLIAETKRKNDFTFWLIFGLRPYLGLSERLIQKVKWPNVDHGWIGSTVLTRCIFIFWVNTQNWTGWKRWVLVEKLTAFDEISR